MKTLTEKMIAQQMKIGDIDHDAESDFEEKD